MGSNWLFKIDFQYLLMLHFKMEVSLKPWKISVNY